MSTYTQLLYHIVFSTRNREKTLAATNREELFKYMAGIIAKKNSHLYRINGVSDHIHIATHLRPSLNVSDFVKDVKLATSSYIREKCLFPQFRGWQDGYGAFSCSFNQKDRLFEYIIAQEAHHQATTFENEYRNLLEENGVAFEEKYLL